MTVIQQGDQYPLPVKICMNDTVVTPDDVDDVRIKVGTELKEYSKGELTFDDGFWNYPLTEEMTQKLLNGSISVQTAVKIGEDIMLSTTQTVSVGFSIITEDW